MTIKITLTADPDTGAGVDFNGGYDAFFRNFAPYGFPLFLGPTETRTTQVVHLDTPEKGKEAESRAVLLGGDDFEYTFANHSVSGTIETVQLVELGDAYNSRTGDLVLDDGIVKDATKFITISGLDISNRAGVKGDVHEIIAGLMGGGPDGTKADAAPLTEAIWSEAHTVAGSAGGDRYVGTRYADTIRGEGGADRLYGADGDDTLNGGSGADRLYGGAGNDTLWGGSGGDRLSGGTGNDRLSGGTGNDTLDGGSGDDSLSGGPGRDTLSGGTGADRLTGGTGADQLTGGGGADTFIFGSLADTTGDTIRDFARGQGDRIQLTGIDANENRGGNQAFAFIGTQGFHGVAGELRYQIGSATTAISGDTDGDGASDFRISLTGRMTLTEDSFLL